MLSRQFLSLLTKRNRLQKAKQWLPTTTTLDHNFGLTTHAPTETEPNVDSYLNYSKEDSARILYIINNCSLEQLMMYSISKVGINKLQSWKKRHGPLRSPKDLLEIEGLNVKILQKFCNSLLKNEPKASTIKTPLEQIKNNTFVIPTLNREETQNIRTCVALHIGVSSVSWARLEVPEEQAEGHIAPCLLTDWQFHRIAEKKQHLENLVYQCIDLAQNIPIADCYLFENPIKAQDSNTGNAEQKNINIEKAQITAMLSFALSTRRLRSFQKQQQQRQKEATHLADKQHIIYEPNVFYMRNFLHSRLFCKFIGKEQVSTEGAILHLMRSFCDNSFKDSAEKTLDQRNIYRGNVHFTPEQLELYYNAKDYRREFLGQALLLNLAFVRLVLIRDGVSIRKVTRNHKKMKEAE